LSVPYFSTTNFKYDYIFHVFGDDMGMIFWRRCILICHEYWLKMYPKLLWILIRNKLINCQGYHYSQGYLVTITMISLLHKGTMISLLHKGTISWLHITMNVKGSHLGEFVDCAPPFNDGALPSHKGMCHSLTWILGWNKLIASHIILYYSYARECVKGSHLTITDYTLAQGNMS